MSIDTASEASLVRAALQGRTEAFEVLLHRYQSLVCAITYSATGNRDISEELAQDSFVRAWTRLKQLEDPSKFKSWLCSITRRSIQNWIRANQRNPVKSSALDNLATTQTDPAQVVVNQEQQQLVHQALSQLPENLRIPLILFYREQKSSKEVAKHLDLSDEAARQRIARARHQLREQMTVTVEQTLSQTKPGQAFGATVLAAITAQAIKSTASAVTASAATPMGSGISALLSTTAAKLVVSAASVALIAGGAWLYQANKSKPEGALSVTTPLQPRETLPAPEPITQPSPVQSEPIANVRPLDSQQPITVNTPSEPQRPAQAAEPTVAPFAFAPRGVLSGRMTDKVSGKPVTDASVRLSGHHPDVHTDANGVYVFDSLPQTGTRDHELSIYSRTHIGIDASGHHSLKISLDASQTSVKHFELTRACMIDITVVDEEGSPIANAEVIGTHLADEHPRIINYFPGYYGNPDERIGIDTFRKTDAAGHVRLGGFPVAETNYQITAWHKGRERHYTHAPGHAIVQLNDPHSVPSIQIVMKKGTSVRGHIAYADGVPGNDLKVLARPKWWHSNVTVDSCLPDPNGYFTLTHIVPGAYQIRAIPYQDGGYYETVLETTFPLAPKTLLTLESSRTSPESLVSISGQIIYPAGLDHDNIRVQAYSGNRTRVETYVKRNRRGKLIDSFSINRLQPGTYRLEFRGNIIADKILHNVLAPRNDLRVELTIPPKYMLTGQVLDQQTHQPIRAYQARLNKTRNSGTSANHWIDIRNQTGQFALEAASPGNYQIQIVAPGYAPQWTLSLDTDAAEPIHISLRPGGRIVGTVSNAKGQPIHDAQVIPLSLASGNDGQGRHRFVNDKGAVRTVRGQFELTHIPAGTETLKVVHADYSFTLVKDIAVQEGQSTDSVHIILPEAASIQGHVYDVNGVPLVNETIRVQDLLSAIHPESQELGIATTDANGFYRIEGLPAKYCSIVRRRTTKNLGVMKRSLVLTAGDPLEVNLGGASVLAWTLEPSTPPAAGQRLLLADQRYVELSAYVNYTQLDQQGAFAFAGTEPGLFNLFLEDPNHVNEWILITQIDVPDHDLDVGHLEPETQSLKVTIESTSSAASLSHLYIAEPGQILSTPMAMGKRPRHASEPWQFHNLTAGTYDLVIAFEDQSQWRKPIHYDPSKPQITVTLETGTAQLSGKILGKNQSTLMLWCKARDYYRAIEAGTQHHFQLSGLPAGDYAIGTVLDYINKGPALAEFALRKNQTLVQDITIPEHSGMSGLMIQLSDSMGRPIEEATVTLESNDPAETPMRTIHQGNVYMTLGKVGNYTLVITSPGYQPLSKPLTLETIIEEGVQPETMEISLEEARD